MFRHVPRVLLACLFCVAAAAAAAQEAAPAEEPGKKTQVRIDLADVLTQAREAYRARDFERAVGLYQLFVRFAPEIRVARVELSFALAALGERERAARLLRDIDTDGLAPEVIDIIGRIIGPGRLTFFLVPEFFMDSNVTGQTKDEIVIINGLSFRLSEDARGQRGFGYGITTGASYRLTDADPRTTLTAGVSMRDFEEGRNDQQNFFTSLSMRFDVGEFTLTPALSGVYRYKDWQPREAEAGVGLAVGVNLGPVRNTLGGRYRRVAGKRGFTGTLDRKVYETYDSVSFGYDGFSFRLDGRYILEDWTETDNQDHYKIIAGFDTTYVDLPWVIPTVGVSYTFRDFENLAPFFNVERLDREYEGHIQLLFRDWKLFGTNPFIRYEYTKVTSNIALFAFDRHEMSVGLRAITWYARSAIHPRRPNLSDGCGEHGSTGELR